MARHRSAVTTTMCHRHMRGSRCLSDDHVVWQHTCAATTAAPRGCAAATRQPTAPPTAPLRAPRARCTTAVQNAAWCRYIVVTNPHIKKVYNQYHVSFETFRRLPPIRTLEENQEFSQVGGGGGLGRCVFGVGGGGLCA